MTINRPHHVGAAELTYIPRARGFVSLFAGLDWARRRVLAGRVSTTRTTDVCLAAVQEALPQQGTPTMFNPDQGCPFTRQEFTGLLTHHGIQIRLEGKGCCRDNVWGERLWKSLQYEKVYRHAYDTVRAAHQGLERSLRFDTQTRPQQALDGQTPDSGVR